MMAARVGVFAERASARSRSCRSTEGRPSSSAVGPCTSAECLIRLTVRSSNPVSIMFRAITRCIPDSPIGIQDVEIAVLKGVGKNRGTAHHGCNG